MSLGSLTGFDDETIELLRKIEKVTEGHGLGRAQRALASALWRMTNRHPCLRATVDMDPVAIVIRDGGRRITLELEVFPPKASG